MNSKQRRSDARKYRHRVYLTAGIYEEYFDRFMWCKESFGPLVNHGWRCRLGFDEHVWEFDTMDKASLFALRWSNI